MNNHRLENKVHTYKLNDEHINRWLDAWLNDSLSSNCINIHDALNCVSYIIANCTTVPASTDTNKLDLSEPTVLRVN